MTGMKQGAGENPFTENPESEDENPETEVDKSDSNISQSDTTEEIGSDRSRQRGQSQSIQIPYKFRRDGVQDGRDRVPLFLHAKTKSDERDALRVVEDRFDSNVSLTDLREALVMTGLNHLDEVEDHLEKWGYGMTFDD